MNSRTLTQAPDPHQAPPVPVATRRDLFGTMGAMLLLTAAEAGPAKAVELDGELLAACAALGIADRAMAAAEANPRVDVPDMGPLCDRRADLLLVMAGIPARTPEGIRSKAESLRAALRFDVPSMLDDTFEGSRSAA